MNRVARIALTASALSLGLALAACESFDPTSLLDSDIFSTKKKLPGERQPVFPEGTPGVAQGVPPELVKGYQPPEPEAKDVQKAEAKPKAKPKPKIAATPKEQRAPTAVTVRPAPAQAQSQGQWPDPPPQQPAAASTGGGWPGSPQPAGGGV